VFVDAIKPISLPVVLEKKGKYIVQVQSLSSLLLFDEAEDAFHGSLQNPAMQQDAMFSTKLIFYKQQLQQLLLG
jgi:hypothetical protein